MTSSRSYWPSRCLTPRRQRRRWAERADPTGQASGGDHDAPEDLNLGASSLSACGDCALGAGEKQYVLANAYRQRCYAQRKLVAETRNRTSCLTLSRGRQREVLGIYCGPLFRRRSATLRAPAEEEVLGYSATLVRAKRETAEQYVRRTPRQIDTAYRRRIEAALNWTPINIWDGTNPCSGVRHHDESQ